jgi:Stage II sporulation protein E (SpoIIE)
VGADDAVRKTFLVRVPTFGGRRLRRDLAGRKARRASHPRTDPTSAPDMPRKDPRAEAPVEHQPVWRLGAGAIATASAILVYVLATSTEIAVIERVRPGEMELTWISDAVLAVAFGVAVFLWLHLKSTRMRPSRLEREHIVLDTQLSLAAGPDPLLLAACGPPGLFPDQTYRTAFLPVLEGAVSILVTDGITEAFDVLGLANGDPVAALVAHVPQPMVPIRICNALIEHTAPALASGDWQDDRTVVAFALNSSTGVSSSVVST